MPSIVQVNVSVITAPTPSTLQQTGAFISCGGTTRSTNSLTLITQVSDLTAILATASALSTAVFDAQAGKVHATTSGAHNLTVGQVYRLTIAGCTPTGYNGTFDCTITGTPPLAYP